MDCARLVTILLLEFFFPSGTRAEIHECPDDWLTYEAKCYQVVMYPESNHESARAYCGVNGAALIGINTQAEHEFISTWLMSNDLSRRQFFTSGLIRNMAEEDLIWESDGSRVAPEVQFWLSDAEKQKSGQYITYKYGVITYGWSRASAITQLPFICEIKKEEAYRIKEDNRDFDYGLNVSDPNEVPRGPKFSKEPRDVMMVERTTSAVIDCAASANPSPTYQMYKIVSSTGATILLTPDLDARYILTNGRLTINNPTELKDAGKYYCEANNPYGTVLSSAGHITFGDIGEFSNVQREKVRVRKYHYGIIRCEAPNYKPELAYAWMKHSLGNFIRTDLMLHLFPSANGNLYFHEVGSADAAVYYCMVKLMPPTGVAIGTFQPPARVSMAIEMEVTDSVAINWGPEISNDFPAVFPRQPLRGHEVRIECVAFGTMPIMYTWYRQDLPMPPDSYYLEEKRIFVIPNVQLDDSGVYVCRASRGSGAGAASQEKNIRLTVESVPYFIYPLQDKHVDEGRQLTWLCQARAQPAPTYSWLRNGKILASVPGDMDISGNVLTIFSPSAAKHDGMYQCRASNRHSTVYSSGQLRVLGFKPTFYKNPLQSITTGAIGGTVTIACSPEAAPTPTYTWLKNGVAVGSPDANARIRILSNGNIVISDLTTADAGTYTCQVENSYGSESSTGVLKIVGRTTISIPPKSTFVVVNNTAFLACQASYDPVLDLEVTWRFQNEPLNWRDTHYKVDSQNGINGLYIRGAQKWHSGLYTCVAVTAFDSISANATLSVRGPPGEPAGLLVKMQMAGSRTVTLQWSAGETWGSAIISYTIQANTNFNTTWRIIEDGISDSSTIVQGRDRRETVVRDLKPWTGYKFRICARNSYGVGPYSQPTGCPLTGFLPDVHSGFLHEQSRLLLLERGRWAISVSHGYHWALKIMGDLDSDIMSTTACTRPGPMTGGLRAKQVTSKVMYTLLVKNFIIPCMTSWYNHSTMQEPVQNSTVATIYSAEDIPIGTATNVMIYRHNATALIMKWTPIPDTREIMRGKILGYQINYWREDERSPLIMNHYTGEASDGATVIGLVSRTWYRMDVQVYNSAGMGPRSEWYRQRTWKNEIKTQPTEITVYSHGPDSVYVTWRGVTSKPNEESLISYVMQYWPSTDNIRTAKGIYTGKNNFGVIYGIQKDVLYKLRVYPYSRGGDGGSSPDRLFTLGGQIRFDPVTTDIFAAASCPSIHLLVLLFIALLWIL